VYLLDRVDQLVESDGIGDGCRVSHASTAG
jgi:hypothetical protein